MKADRNIELLVAGTRAAHKRLFRQEELKKGEYIHDFLTIYSDLEDALYSAFTAIQLKQTQRINRCAGDVIVKASMLAEMTDDTPKVERPWPWQKKQGGKKR
jgi:hypothetical protein